MKVTERDWIRDYVDVVTPLVEHHGGRYLARTTRVDKLEGSARVPGTRVAD